MFLNRKSPAYAGGMMQFLLSPELRRGFDDIAATVRKGGTAQSELGAIAPEHPIWLEFARGMAPMMMMPAQMLADLIPLEGAPKGAGYLGQPRNVGNGVRAKASARAPGGTGLGAGAGTDTRECGARGIEGSLQHDRGERIRGGSRVRLRRGAAPEFSASLQSGRIVCAS